jgi:hypothetical protein
LGIPLLPVAEVEVKGKSKKADKADKSDKAE